MPKTTARELAIKLSPHLEVLKNVLYVFENAPSGVHSTLIETAKNSTDAIIALVRQEMDRERQ